MRGTLGTGLCVRPAAGGRLGAGAPDRLFGEVHLDTFADGMAMFCNTNGRREEGRPDRGKSRGKGKKGWNGNKATRKQGTRKKGCVSSLGGGSHRVSPPPALASPPPLLPHPPQPPAALPLLRRTPPLLPACARVLFVTGREDYLDHGLPVRSHRGSPGPQSAPSTQTIWGDLCPRFPRFQLGEGAKQNRTNPGAGGGRGGRQRN